MAGTSVLKLKVDDKEYNASLKQAQQGLQHLGQALNNAGKSFTQVDKSVVDYVRSIGQMEAQSKSARGRIGEMSNAFIELSLQYKQMSEEVKNSDIGKALAASLEKLKQRAQEAQSQMDAATKSLQSNATAGNEDSSMLSKLADKFTINIDALKLFNIGLNAADGALQVAKDAFFSSEQNVDEWGRIIASSQSLYEGFVTSLNNSDFTGFMSRIDDIVKAAREAYNELDRLGTMRTIQAPQIERQNSENVRMRTMLMTGRYIAPSDGRAPLQGMKTGDLLSPSQIKTLERQLQGGMNTIVKLTQNELEQTGRAIDAYYNKLAKENGMTMEEFKKGTSSMAEFDQRQEGYRKYQQWRQENSFTDMYGNRQVREGNPYQEFKKWGTFRVDKMGENSYNDLVGLIRQQQQQQSQIYSTIGQAYRTINRAEGVTVKGLMNPGAGSGGGGKTTPEYIPLDGSIAAQAKLVSDLQRKWNEAGEDMRTGYLYQLIEAEKKLKSIKDEQQALRDMKTNGEVKGISPVGLSDQLFKGKSLKELQGVKLELKLPKDKTEASLTKEIGSMAGGISQMVGSMEALGIELPEGMKNVVNGVTSLISIVSGIATIVTAIEALTAADTIIPFARGGVVHAANGFVSGNRYSGDMIPAALNAGELVLNKAQQGNLASQLQGAGLGGMNMVGEISGEAIKIVLNRYLKRTGQGEIVTW